MLYNKSLKFYSFQQCVSMSIVSETIRDMNFINFHSSPPPSSHLQPYKFCFCFVCAGVRALFVYFLCTFSRHFHSLSLKHARTHTHIRLVSIRFFCWVVGSIFISIFFSNKCPLFSSYRISIMDDEM